MVKSKLALSTGTADLDHYLAVGDGQAAMTIDTSAALGTIAELFAGRSVQERAARCRPDAGPGEPGWRRARRRRRQLHHEQVEPRRSRRRRTSSRSSSRRRSVQSEWAAATGYVPVLEVGGDDGAARASGTRSIPSTRSRTTSCCSGPENEATAGPVLGAYGAEGSGHARRDHRRGRGRCSTAERDSRAGRRPGRGPGERRDRGVQRAVSGEGPSALTAPARGRSVRSDA